LENSILSQNENQNHIWVKVLKSDLYDLKFICEPYTKMKCRINLYDCNTEKDSTLFFIDETNPRFEIELLKENTILKFTHCTSSKIQIEYKDKYNNSYT